MSVNDIYTVVRCAQAPENAFSHIVQHETPAGLMKVQAGHWIPSSKSAWSLSALELGGPAGTVRASATALAYDESVDAGFVEIGVGISSEVGMADAGAEETGPPLRSVPPNPPPSSRRFFFGRPSPSSSSSRGFTSKSEMVSCARMPRSATVCVLSSSSRPPWNNR